MKSLSHEAHEAYEAYEASGAQAAHAAVASRGLGENENGRPARDAARLTDRIAPTRPVRHRGLSYTRKQFVAGWGVITPFLLAFLLVFALPVFQAVRDSLYTQVPVGGGLFGGGGMVDQFVGLANFRAVITNRNFWAGMGRVLVYAAIQIPIMIGVALVLAMVLDSYLVRRVGGFRLAYFLPFAIPGAIAAMLWTYMYNPSISPFTPFLPEGTRIVTQNTVIFAMANMTTWTFTGYNMLIFLAALQAIPHDLYEAARIDGATGWQIATRIKLPILGPAALLTVLLSIVGTIQLFTEPTLLQSQHHWMGFDYTPMMMAFNSLMGVITPSGRGPASAISVVMALLAGVLAAIYALVQRKLSR